MFPRRNAGMDRSSWECLGEHSSHLVFYAVPQLVTYDQPLISASLPWENANERGHRTNKKRSQPAARCAELWSRHGHTHKSL